MALCRPYRVDRTEYGRWIDLTHLDTWSSSISPARRRPQGRRRDMELACRLRYLDSLLPGARPSTRDGLSTWRALTRLCRGRRAPFPTHKTQYSTDMDANIPTQDDLSDVCYGKRPEIDNQAGHHYNKSYRERGATVTPLHRNHMPAFNRIPLSDLQRIPPRPHMLLYEDE